MKALVVNGPYNAEFVDVEKPKATDDMALVKVVKAGVCATDISIYTGESSFVKSGQIKYPVRIGHEWAGIVEEVGENVKNFKKGDRVVSESGVSCGKCAACIAGNYSDCMEIHSVGTVNAWDGCFAEYMLMPERHLYHLADNITDESAALIEPMGIAYDAFSNIKINKDTVVAVVGTGTIGMASVWIAKCLGAEKVIMIGRNDNKLGKAKDVGATDLINNTRCDAVTEIHNLTNGKGVDLLIETSGSDAVLKDAVNMVANGGTISIISFYEKNLDDFPMDEVVLRRINIKGVAGSFGAPGEVCKMMEKCDGNPEGIITHRIEFDEVIKFFENIKGRKEDWIKVMINF